MYLKELNLYRINLNQEIKNIISKKVHGKNHPKCEV